MTLDNARVHVNLKAKNAAGSWISLKDNLVRAEVNLGDISAIGTGSTGVDGVVRSMTATIHNEGSLMPVWSDTVANLDTASWPDTDVVGQTSDGGEKLVNKLFNTTHKYAQTSFSPRMASPILWPGREVYLEVAVTARNVISPASSDWVGLFHGILGDDISTDGAEVTFTARDLAKRLMDTYIEGEQIYPLGASLTDTTTTPSYTIMQQILNNNGLSDVLVYVKDDPGFDVLPYKIQYQTVWDALQQLTLQCGYWLGYRWDSVTGTFRLTLMEPPRTKTTPDYTFTLDDDIYTQIIGITDTTLRNVVQVTFRDKEEGSSTKGQRVTIEATDDASIAQYGRRVCAIEEDDASLIDTTAEAQAFAAALLSDMSLIGATTQLDLPLLPQLDVFDMVSTEDPRVSETVDKYGLVSVRHIIDVDGKSFLTQAVGMGKVVGGQDRWLRLETKPGSPGKPTKIQADYEIVGAIPSDNINPSVFFHFESGNPPSPEASGDYKEGEMWHDSASGNTWVWNGEQWDQLGSSGSNTGKVFLSVDAPTTASIGDWWINPDSNYVAAVKSTAGWAWVHGTHVFPSATAPTPVKIGDMWVDGGGVLRYWDGTTGWTPCFVDILSALRLRGPLDITGNVDNGVSRIALGVNNIEMNQNGIYKYADGTWTKVEFGNAPTYSYISAEPIWMYYIGNSVNSYTTAGQTGTWLFDSVTFTTGVNESKIRCVFHAYRAGIPKLAAYMYVKVNSTTYGNTQMTEDWPNTRHNTAVDVVVNVAPNTSYTVEFYVQVTDNPNQYAQVVQGIDTSPKVFRQATINAI